MVSPLSTCRLLGMKLPSVKGPPSFSSLICTNLSAMVPPHGRSLLDDDLRAMHWIEINRLVVERQLDQGIVIPDFGVVGGPRRAVHDRTDRFSLIELIAFNERRAGACLEFQLERRLPHPVDLPLDKVGLPTRVVPPLSEVNDRRYERDVATVLVP